MQINLIADASVSSAPAGFTAAIEEAASILEQDFSGNFTVNIRYGWGTWDNQVDPGLAGESGAEGGPVNGTLVSYQTLKSWLTGAETSPDQELAYASLPTTTSSFPGGQTTFYVSSAQEKALGVYTGSSTAVDGAIGFGTASSPTFWLEAALHEICHAMGRTTDFYAGDPTIMDLFRYSSAGQYSWTGYEPSYLSFNGGATIAANFSTVSDYADFAVDSYTPSDPFDYEISGTTQNLTGLDIELMNALGFSSTFEPSTITISIVEYAVVASGQAISVPSLIASISNPHGDTIASEMFIDEGGGSGHLTLNGVAQPDGVWIYATSGQAVQYVGGSSSGTDTLEIGIYDSTTNSYAFSSTISAVTTGGEQSEAAPILTSLVASPNSDVANVGQVVTLTVNLSEAVTVSGTPTLTLNDGGTAVFSGGSGTNALTFSYMVLPTDTSVSSLTVTTVNLNGGSIQDANGNVANLSLTGLNQSGPQIQIPADTVAEIDAIYEAVFQQQPTAGEVGTWLAMEPSLGDATLITALITSQEAEQDLNSIIQIVNLATGQLPASHQLAGWVSYEEAGGSLVSVANAFADSIMFQQTYGGGATVDPESDVNAPIMQTIIQHALGTASTPTQVQAWVNTGLSIAQVFVYFSLGDQYSAYSQNTDQQYLAAAVDAVVEANGGSGNGGTLAGATYDDSGYMIDTLVTSAAGVTNTYNFGTSAVLEVGAVSHGNAVANMTGSDTTLEVLATASFVLDSLTYNSDLVLDSTGGSIDITMLVDTTSTAVEMVLSPTSVYLYGSNSITIGSISDQALSTINGMGSTGALSFGAASTPLTQPDLVVLGGSGALTVVASGDGDTVTQLNTSNAGGTLTLAGSADTITIAGGANTITADGAQDVLQLGAIATGATIASSQTVHASGAGDTISFATIAADGTDVFWGASSTVDGGSSSVGLGANDTIDFGNNTGNGYERIVLTGDLTGATTSGGASTASIAMTTLGNVVHGAGDEIVFNNATNEIIASLTNSGQVNVSSATSLAKALDLAAAGAANSQSGHLIAAHTGVVDWFQYGGDTYIVEAINGGSAAASHTALAATDAVVQILGQVNLSGDALASHLLTL
jgi:hypothetical protein